jgi:hypothetical protein
LVSLWVVLFQELLIYTHRGTLNDTSDLNAVVDKGQIGTPNLGKNFVTKFLNSGFRRVVCSTNFGKFAD